MWDGGGVSAEHAMPPHASINIVKPGLCMDLNTPGICFFFSAALK